MRALVASIVFIITLGTIYWLDNSKILNTPQLNQDVNVQALVLKNIQNTDNNKNSRPVFQLTSSIKPTQTPVNAAIAPTLAPTTPVPTTPIIIVTSPTPQNTISPTFLPATTSTPAPTATSATTSLISTPTPSPAQSQKININTAGLEELDKITGIGPAYAKNIIDYRTANGPFQKIEDIINVKGIGDKTFQKMKNEITI